MNKVNSVITIKGFIVEKRYYRAKEIAIYLGVTKTTIWNYASIGKLTPIKLSEHATVFDIQEINTLIENATVKVA